MNVSCESCNGTGERLEPGGARDPDAKMISCDDCNGGGLVPEDDEAIFEDGYKAACVNLVELICAQEMEPREAFERFKMRVRRLGEQQMRESGGKARCTHTMQQLHNGDYECVRCGHSVARKQQA